MSELRSIDIGEVLALAADALSRDSGRAGRLGDVEVLSKDTRRNFIARAVAHYADGDTKRVILKSTRSPTYDPTADNVLQKSGFAKEWVACALLAVHARDRGHGAALLAGDVASGLMVFEDLGAGLTSLVEPLLEGSAEDAENALKLYATALGRLHADTVGCRDAHHRMLQSIFGASRSSGKPGWRVEDDAELVGTLIGGSPPMSELALLSSRLADPGPWLTLIHGDPCPDNSLLVERRIRLIDYEFARPSHALLDGAYWRIGFPTCWCAGRVPDDVAARVDASYRAELGKSIALALDDAAYHTELTYLCAAWLFTSLSSDLGDALEDDDMWGTWSIRGRLLWYLEAIIRQTEAANLLPGINETARGWLSELRRRWPDAAPLGLYPAFASKPS